MSDELHPVFQKIEDWKSDNGAYPSAALVLKKDGTVVQGRVFVDQRGIDVSSGLGYLILSNGPLNDYVALADIDRIDLRRAD